MSVKLIAFFLDAIKFPEGGFKGQAVFGKVRWDYRFEFGLEPSVLDVWKNRLIVSGAIHMKAMLPNEVT